MTSGARVPAGCDPLGEWLYHWSPRDRRKSIERSGLVPGKPSRDRMWKPPYVCLSDDPMLAWDLSGRMEDEPPTFDLWLVHVADVGRFESIFERYRSAPDRLYVKEVRVYERIYKSKIRWVAERPGKD